MASHRSSTAEEADGLVGGNNGAAVVRDTRGRPSAAAATWTATRRGHRPWSARIEWVLLLVSPLIGAVVAGAAPMAVGLRSQWTMIDPTFYTAYSQHPGDLLQRFGDANYYWVRLGFVLPAAAFHAMFGPVPGFIAFRYVLALVAVVSGYLLVRRHFSRAAAWCFVAAVTTNPVVLTAWGSDYPDSAALSYLVAAAACLAVSLDRQRHRLAVRLLGGVFLGLAVNSHVATLPFVVAMAVAAVLLTRGRQRWVELVATVAGAVVITAVLAATAATLWGHADIITPSVEQYLRLQRPDQVAIWHSATWDWFARATYLLVPVVLVIGWVVARLRDRRVAGRPETFLVTAIVLGLAGSGWKQATDGASWEYFLYSSLLWWSVGYLTAMVVWRLTPEKPVSIVRRWSPVAVVVVAAGLHVWTAVPVWRFSVWPVGVALLVGVALIGVVLVAAGRRDTVSGAAVGTAYSVLVLGVAAALTVGQPPAVYAPGQARYPQVDFGAVDRLDTGTARDVYRVISEIPDLVPSDSSPVFPWAAGGRGFPGPPLDPIAQGAAQYPAASLATTMPSLTEADARRLDRTTPGTYVLLLSKTGDEFAAAGQALGPWRPETVVRRKIVSGNAELHVELLKLAE